MTAARWATSFVFCFAIVTSPGRAEELPSSRKEIGRALDEVRDQYGMDAVRMQAFLLRAAVGGGSIFEASAGVGGFETHEEKRYLRFDLVTGIVYDEKTVAAAERPARIWVDVVDPALRNFTSLDVPADGIVLHVVYQHDAYRDRNELLQKSRERPAPSEEVHLRLSCGEIVEFAHARLSAGDLLDHASVLLDGKPARIDLSRLPAAQPPTELAPPFFPDEEP